MSSELDTLKKDHPDRYHEFLKHCSINATNLQELTELQINMHLGLWMQSQSWYCNPPAKLVIENRLTKGTMPFKKLQFQNDKKIAALLGLAIGDAVGAPLEFKRRGRFTPLTDMTSGGKFQMQLGEWTDDTAMALCLADSLIECNGFDAKDQMDRYWRWGDEGYNSTRATAFGIGKTVAKSLMRYKRSGNPYSGPESPETAGNGSLMRIAPIAIYFSKDRADALKYAELSSKTTHAAEECIQACMFFVDVLINAFEGRKDKEEVLTPSFKTDHFSERLKGVIEKRNYANKSSNDVLGSGYVVESLEAALWAFWNHEGFEEAVLAAANLGDDSDTTAAITGQIAGAYYGKSSIPSGWLEDLYESERIEQIARNCCVGIQT